MKSMTSYGYKEKHDKDKFVSVEIKGYNSRFLDLIINLPPQLSALDIEIRHYIAEKCRRGKIEVNIYFKELNSTISVSVNKAAVRAYFASLVEVFETLNEAEIEILEKFREANIETPKTLSAMYKTYKEIKEWKWWEPNLASVMEFEGVLEIEKTKSNANHWEYVEPILVSAMDQFDEGRIREGNHTEKDILYHVTLLESRVKTISSYVPDLEATIRENIKNRFLELLGLGVVKTSPVIIDENRILQETAMLLMKYTISEELSRLSAHLYEFRSEANQNPSPGKKLDFLCQEINREINTIGSKTPIVEVSRAVVDMKDALENIREQLRNIE